VDSVTQFVLGACVGTAVLGRRLGPRKAALVGGLLGTVPDLDVFYPFDGPVDDFVLHRGASHSLLIHALVTPVFGEALLRVFRRFREEGLSTHRLAVYLAVFLCFATHALLDAMTIYGTQLFWPVSKVPIGIGSVFIIDPVYTLPLLVMTLWALFQGEWRPGFRRGLAIVLVMSTGYLGWSLAGQQIAMARAVEALGGAQEGDRILASPAPFNTLFWKTIVLRGGSYANIYVPMLGDAAEIRAYAHPRNPDWLACAESIDDVMRVAAFAKGFVRLERAGDALRIADLRMGLTPGYVFRFEAGRFDGAFLSAIPTVRIVPQRSFDNDADWLFAGIAGTGVTRRIEAGAAMKLPNTGAFPSDQTVSAEC